MQRYELLCSHTNISGEKFQNDFLIKVKNLYIPVTKSGTDYTDYTDLSLMSIKTHS